MNFAPIINSHPSEREAIDRLKKLLQEFAGQRAEFDLNRLCDLVRPNNRDELSIALGELARQGGIKQVLRVISPRTQGGIGDYESLDQIPRFVHDERTDTEIEINPDDWPDTKRDTLGVCPASAGVRHQARVASSVSLVLPGYLRLLTPPPPPGMLNLLRPILSYYNLLRTPPPPGGCWSSRFSVSEDGLIWKVR